MINWESDWNSLELFKMSQESEPCQILSIQANARIFYYWTQTRHSFSYHGSLYNQEQAQHFMSVAVSVKVVLCIVNEPHFFQTCLLNILFLIFKVLLELSLFNLSVNIDEFLVKNKIIVQIYLQQLIVIDQMSFYLVLLTSLYLVFFSRIRCISFWRAQHPKRGTDF